MNYESEYPKVAGRVNEQISRVFHTDPHEALMLCTAYARALVLLTAFSRPTRADYSASMIELVKMLQKDANICLKDDSLWRRDR